jgi:hypothetical protein
MQAQELHRERRNRIYVILRVENSLDIGKTRLAASFVDPIKCLAEGKISISVPDPGAVVSW